MSTFPGSPLRHREALNTCDPLKGTWLLDLLDPISPAESDGSPSWPRVIAFILILYAPLVIFSAIPSPLFGGKLIGKGSVTADIGLFAVLLFLTMASILLPIGRRKIGDLVNILQRSGVVNSSIQKFDVRTMSLGKTLRFLEWLSRVDGYRGFIWFVIMVCDQIVVYFALLMKDAHPMWHSSVAVPGTLMYSLSSGSTQPNLAGIWAFAVWSPLVLYLMIVVGRLLVVFACLCRGRPPLCVYTLVGNSRWGVEVFRL